MINTSEILGVFSYCEIRLTHFLVLSLHFIKEQCCQ